MTTVFDEIFSIPVLRTAPKLRRYRVVWPCGSEWEIDRDDLEVPEYAEGKQTGVTHVYTSLKEARECLLAEGCRVELIKGD